MIRSADGVSWEKASVFSVVREYGGRLEACGFLRTDEGKNSFVAYRYPNGEYHLVVSSQYPAVPGISRRMSDGEIQQLGALLETAQKAGEQLGQPHALDAMIAAIRAATSPTRDGS